MAEPQTSRHGDSEAITLVVTMTIEPEREEEFLELARTTIPKVHAKEPGTTLYALHRHPTERHTYVWVERYRDAAALEAHGKAPYIAEAMAKLPRVLAKEGRIQQLGQLLPE